MSLQLSLNEVINLRIEQKMQTFLDTNLVAEVVNVAEFQEMQFVDVKPVILEENPLGVLDSPTIFRVPVVFPSGGGALFSMPIKVGDHVLVMVTKKDLSYWVMGGGESYVTKDVGHFDLNDSVAIPCIYTANNNLKPNPDNVELKFEDMHFQLKKGNIIDVGNANTTINIAEDGDFLLTTPNTTISISDNGRYRMTTPNAEFFIQEDGYIQLKNLNNDRLLIQPSGRIVLGRGDDANVDIEIDSANKLTIKNSANSSIVMAASGAVTINATELTVNAPTSVNSTIFSTDGITTNAQVTADADGALPVQLTSHKHGYIDDGVGALTTIPTNTSPP